MTNLSALIIHYREYKRTDEKLIEIELKEELSDDVDVLSTLEALWNETYRVNKMHREVCIKILMSELMIDRPSANKILCSEKFNELVKKYYD